MLRPVYVKTLEAAHAARVAMRQHALQPAAGRLADEIAPG
jgi:hypothetical protein